MKTTKNKNVTVGAETLYRKNENGELEEVPCQVVEQKINKDSNFMKIWLGHIMAALDEVGNKKLKVVKFLLENMDKRTNLLVMTQREMADNIGVSSRTVNLTLKALEKANFLTAKTGAYYINPNVIFRGGHEQRMNVLTTYHKVMYRQSTIEERIKEQNLNVKTKKTPNQAQEQ